MPTATWQYVYGVIPTDDLVLFDVEGIDSADDVHTIVEGDLAIVTSSVDRESLQNLDRASAVRYLSAHQRVLETVMRDYLVLPVKFGTTLPNQDALRMLLRQGNQLLHTTLNTYAGKQQTEVIVLWNLQHVFQEIAAEEQITALRAQIGGRAPDETVNERIALGQMVHAALQERRTQISEQVLGQLRDLADDIIINPTMDDSMVVNVALLIDEEHQSDLDKRLDILDTLFEGKLQIRCVGPLPPYSFATLNAQMLPFEAIDMARQQLGLDERVSAIAIKRAYRQQATEIHPDHNPSSEHAIAQMETLTNAYQLLSALAKAQAPKTDEEALDWTCQLDRAAVERTILLSVVRHDG